ncbi:MAG: Na+/H+ antiporter subunit E [Wenzhouxiangellaceae bacterium]
MRAFVAIRRTLRYGWQLGAVLALLWIGLTGATDWVPGLVVVTFALFVSYRFAPMQRPHFRLPCLWRFLNYFLWASLRGGFDIAGRALDPRLPLEITNWKHHFRVPPGQPRTVLIAAISLLPGTLSRGLDDDWVLVNSIAGDQHLEIEKLEQLIGDMFGIAPEKDHG